MPIGDDIPVRSNADTNLVDASWFNTIRTALITYIGSIVGAIVDTESAQTLINKTIDADNNTISNLAHGSEVDNPSSGVHGVTGSVVGTSDAQTLTNKTLTTPVLNGTISGTAVKDEDDMTSDSPNHLCTQQSIKAYVDSVAGGGVDYQKKTLGSSVSGINSGTSTILTFNGLTIGRTYRVLFHCYFQTDSASPAGGVVIEHNSANLVRAEAREDSISASRTEEGKSVWTAPFVATATTVLCRFNASAGTWAVNAGSNASFAVIEYLPAYNAVTDYT